MRYFKTAQSIKPSRLFRVQADGTVQHLTSFGMWHGVMFPKMFNHLKTNDLLIPLEEYQAAEYVHDHNKFMRT